MLHFILSLCLLFGTPAPAAVSAPRLAAPVQAYRLDPKASHLTWTGHALVGSWAPTGTVQLAGGTVEAAGATVRAARLAVAMATLAHENADLQTHLRGADFFDVTVFPEATFRLKAVRAGQAEGDLTIKGVTHAITFPLSVRPVGRTLRLTGTAVVDRTQFGVTYNSANFFQNLGDYAIRNEFELVFDVVAVPQ